MKKLFAIFTVLVLILSMTACTQKVPAAVAGDNVKFTVTVVHADGSEKSFSYDTVPGKLGAALEESGLIVGSGDGMFHTVDGEKADWNENKSYWAFYVGDDYASKGIYDTDMVDGANYKLVYTLG